MIMSKKGLILSIALLLGGCSGAGGESSGDALQAHLAADHAWAYVMGDQSAAPDDGALRDMLLELHDAIVSGQTKILSSQRATIEGIEARISMLYGSSRTTDDVSALIAAIAAELAATTPGADRFFYATRQTIEVEGRLWTLAGVDPGIAVLQAALSGGNGATAVAQYVFTGVPVTSYKWPSTAFYSCTSWGRNLQGNEPCSNVSLPIASELPGYILKDSRLGCICVIN